MCIRFAAVLARRTEEVKVVVAEPRPPVHPACQRFRPPLGGEGRLHADRTPPSAPVGHMSSAGMSHGAHRGEVEPAGGQRRRIASSSPRACRPSPPLAGARPRPAPPRAPALRRGAVECPDRRPARTGPPCPGCDGLRAFPDDTARHRCLRFRWFTDMSACAHVALEPPRRSHPCGGLLLAPPPAVACTRSTPPGASPGSRTHATDSSRRLPRQSHARARLLQVAPPAVACTRSTPPGASPGSRMQAIDSPGRCFRAAGPGGTT